MNAPDPGSIGETPRRLWLVFPVIVAMVQLGGSFAAAQGQIDRKGIDALAIVILLIGPSGLFVARRWPYASVALSAGAGCLFIGLGYPFGPIFFSLAVALFAAVQFGRRSIVIALAGLVAVGFAVAVTVDQRDDGDLPLHILIVIGWLTAVLAIAEIVRSRREQFTERRQAAMIANERRLTDERVRLAQELHDVLAHNISLINVQSSVALHLIDQQPERGVAALKNVKLASAEALDELRVALEVFRGGTSPRAPAPRLAQLEQLVEGVRAAGLRVSINIDALPSDVPANVELAAYRIVQEALTNVTRHADARSATVRVRAEQNELIVEVVDDGATATSLDAQHDALDHGGLGLIGMRERALTSGGTFHAGPTANGGFRVEASLPWGTR
jgi:signal transduction histidine kinase